MIRYLCLIASLFLTILFFGEDVNAIPLSSAMPSNGVSNSLGEKSNEFFNSFIVHELSGQVLVSWEAVEVSNVSHYLIERKINNNSYLAIGGINVGRQYNSDANFRFIDQMKRRKDGLFVYRIKQVMKDGSIHYSPEQSLFRLSPASIHIYPHSDPNYLNLEFSQLQPAAFKVVLLDLSGRLLFTQNVGLGESPMGQYQLPISNLSVGMYIVRIEDNFSSWTQRVLIR